MKTFDHNAVRTDLLWQGYDDWTGLWEVVWWIQTEYPEMTGEPARDEARKLLTEMLSDGSIYLCFLDEDTNTETRIGKKEASNILANDRSWEPPDSPKHQLRFLTTEKGAEPLFNRTEAQP